MVELILRMLSDSFMIRYLHMWLFGLFGLGSTDLMKTLNRYQSPLSASLNHKYRRNGQYNQKAFWSSSKVILWKYMWTGCLDHLLCGFCSHFIFNYFPIIREIRRTARWRGWIRYGWGSMYCVNPSECPSCPHAWWYVLFFGLNKKRYLRIRILRGWRWSTKNGNPCGWAPFRLISLNSAWTV